MEDLIAGILFMAIVVAILPFLLWRRRQISRSTDEHREPAEEQVQAERVVRPAVARRMRRRHAAASTSAASTSAEEPFDESDEELDEAHHSAKASSKREKKRQEREAQRQAEEAARENRKTKQDHYAEMRRKKDEEREAQERLMEEEALARKTKEEEAAALDFEKWKGEFSVDAEGTTETEDTSTGLLAEFVDYIKKQKCVPLEDLAAEFKLRTQDCINRIISLETMGRLSGVMDDRGKYIYISHEEMKAVADYIKREGRVSISHLARMSNKFIELEPKARFDTESNSEGIVAA